MPENPTPDADDYTARAEAALDELVAAETAEIEAEEAAVAAEDHATGIAALRAQAPAQAPTRRKSWEGAPSSQPDAVADSLEHLARLIRARVAPVPIGLTLSLFVSSLIDYDPDRDRTQDRVDREPALARDLVRAMGGGKWDKTTQDASGYGSPAYLKLDGNLGVIPATVWVTRDAVCERVVVGRQTVEHPATEEVVLPARPARTEVVEQVEWRCAPLLGAATETPDAVAL